MVEKLMRGKHVITDYMIRRKSTPFEITAYLPSIDSMVEEM